MLESVAISDGHFRVGVIAAGIAVVAAIAMVRFCGSVSLPPKSAPPSGSVDSTATTAQLMTQTATTPAVYQDLVAKDALVAGVRRPTIDEIGRKLVYRVDEARHMLELGRPPIAIAGLELAVVRTGESVGLDI